MGGICTVLSITLDIISKILVISVGLLPKSQWYTPSNGRSCTPAINVHHSIVDNDSSAFLQDQKASYDFNDMDADPKPRDQDPDNW